MRTSSVTWLTGCALALLLAWNTTAQTQKPPLHGRHWAAVTGKPLAATAGAKIFERGGNAVDAACAMLAAVCTMYDDVSWGGETQALIFDPRTKKVIGINGCGVAPTGATPEFFRQKNLAYPPDDGPLAAVTPGNPGGLMVMLADYGTLSLKQVLEPAMELADGYPIEYELVRKINNTTNAAKLKSWPYSARLFFPHTDRTNQAPLPGEIWRQPDLLATLRKLVETEQRALAAGKSRKDAIQAAYDRFYKGDIAEEFCRGSREQGGLHTVEDLANWKVLIEEPVVTNYRGVDVYKLTCWTQGPALLQALNILENFDLQAMGYNSARYLHTLYQAMSLAFADRDFYYGDVYFPPEEPITTLLSKSYAKDRLKSYDASRNNPRIRPGDPYGFVGIQNPFQRFLTNWPNIRTNVSGADPAHPNFGRAEAAFMPPRSLELAEASQIEEFHRGTTSIQAADENGWAISVTPSGGWLPACLAGNTGVGMSQRMQSFVVDEAENPYNVVAPGKRPRVTLTPSMALKNGKPFLCFSVQGGDTQDQNLLQFFLNVVEFGMTVQEACEAANITSYQMRSSFGTHASLPGRMTLTDEVPSWVRKELTKMGYKLDFVKKNSGPITAIYFDEEHRSLWGAASNYGEDYGIAW